MFSRGAKNRRPGRVIVVGVIISLSLLIAVTVMTHLAYQRAEAELVIERDAQLTYLSATRLKVEMDKFSQTLEGLARADVLPSPSVALQRKASRGPETQFADFDGGIVRLDNFGRVVNSEPFRPEIINQDWSNKEYFRELLSSQSVVFSNAVKDGPNDESVVAISVPILDYTGQFMGALVGMFRLGRTSVSTFYASIVRLRLGQSGHTFVVDDNGVILFDSSSNLVGKIYTEETSGIRLSEQSAAARTIDAEGHDIVTAFASIPGTSWTLVTEDEWTILTSSNRQYINILLLIMVVGIVFSITGLIVFIRLRNRALDNLSEAENETNLARQLKRKLLPKQAPILPGWQLNVYHHPASQVSGDYYDFVHLLDGRLMLVMAEVSGSGVPAMLRMATLRAGFRGAAQRLLAPADALEFSSGLLCSETSSDATTKALVGVFDSVSGKFEFACAGEAQAYHVNGKVTSVLATPGAPLGSSLDNRYQQNQIMLRSGERIVLSCDSVVGVKNPTGDQFGEQRLLDVLTRQGDEDGSTMDRLTSQLREFSGEEWEPAGDLTILMLESIHEE